MSQSIPETVSAKLRIAKLNIENFRGIKNAETRFGETNFLVGDNGTGKTTCLAAIARLIPVLRNDERIFLDADFCFDSTSNAEQIKLTYDVEVIISNQPPQTVTLEVIGERQNIGKTRSYLNEQVEAKTTISFRNDTDGVLKWLIERGLLRQRIIRNGWGGGRIAPIPINNDARQRHAATSDREESGNFDGLRARLLELLKKTEIGSVVNKEHPDLLKNVLKFTNRFLGEERFRDILLASSDQLALQRTGGVFQPWDGLSGGEQSAFNLAMAIEFERRNNCQILIIEEPENNIHPTIQRDFIDTLKTYLPNRQIFVATHSPYLFENHLNTSRLIIARKHDSNLTITATSQNISLFSHMSWGELNYHAYNLPTFEFHNELYGWIQERTGQMTERKVENYFSQQHNLPFVKPWIRDKNGQLTTNMTTIMTYIRNFTHHPENTHNQMYTKFELSNAISEMIKIIRVIKGGEATQQT